MTESAARRRVDRSTAIFRAAQELTLERGYQGWTLEELAERVGVSRRTLFNHVESKEHAVLGPRPTIDDAALAEFRSGGPTGRLLHDAVHLAIAAIATSEPAPADLRRCQQIFLCEPALAQAGIAGLEEVLEETVDQSLGRPHATPEAIRLALDLTLILVRHASVETLGEDADTRLTDRLRALLPLLDEVVAAPS